MTNSAEQETVQQFLGDRPNAEQIRHWRASLEQRLAALKREQGRADAAAAATLGGKIDQLRKQIEALRQEEAVTGFVEDSVRVTLAMGSVVDAAGEELDDF
jgi:hypothetical protein